MSDAVGEFSVLFSVICCVSLICRIGQLTVGEENVSVKCRVPKLYVSCHGSANNNPPKADSNI